MYNLDLTVKVNQYPNDRDFNKCVLQVWYTSGDSSLIRWKVPGLHKDGLTDRNAGNDNTQTPKLASGKIDPRNVKSFSFGYCAHIIWVPIPMV